MKLSKLLAIALVFMAARPGPASGQTITFSTLYSFNDSDGNQPLVGMIQGADGNFYGTTSLGGTSTNCFLGCGTVFKISASGVFTNLHNFSGADGSMPETPLVQGRDGYFYGVAIYGGLSDGLNGYGTIFRIDSNGGFTNLWFFTGGPDGDWPKSLIQATDGYLYGFTIDGGANFDGTAFKISTNGNLTPLTSFDSTTNGRAIYQGTDGYFYGTSPFGGTSDNGVVFRMNIAGVITNLYSFTGFVDGSGPAGLIQSSDGYFYGTTYGGGMFFSGTVFRITSSGSLTTLHNFRGNDGAGPASALVLGSDGQFYGTTSIGGSAFCSGGCGTVFRVSTNGTFKTLRSLNGSSDGVAPYGGLVQGYDGKFYGVANAGGNGYGTLFKLFVALNPAANQIGAFQAGTNLIFSVPSVEGETYQLQSRDSLTSGNWSNITGAFVSNSLGGPFALTNVTGTLPPQRFYRFAITP